MQVFENTVLAQPFEPAGERPQDTMLRLRAEPYRLGEVPAGALLLTSGVDVQGDRLELLTLGFGRESNVWVVDHQRFFGETVDLGPDGPWAKLERWRETSYMHAEGSAMQPVSVAVDSGYLTHTVYWFCAKWRRKHYLATKGISEPGRPLLGLPRFVDINHRGQVVKNGCQLWMIGADTAKEQIYRSLEIAEPGFGYVHFPIGLSDEFYEQLTAEKLVRRRMRGVERREWHLPPGSHNEVLDLFALCLAAGQYAGIGRVDWSRLDAVVRKSAEPMIESEAQRPAQQPTRSMQPSSRGTNFATRW